MYDRQTASQYDQLFAYSMTGASSLVADEVMYSLLVQDLVVNKIQVTVWDPMHWHKTKSRAGMRSSPSAVSSIQRQLMSLTTAMTAVGRYMNTTPGFIEEMKTTAKTFSEKLESSSSESRKSSLLDATAAAYLYNVFSEKSRLSLNYKWLNTNRKRANEADTCGSFVEPSVTRGEVYRQATIRQVSCAFREDQIQIPTLFR